MNPNRGGEYPLNNLEKPTFTEEISEENNEGRSEIVASPESSPSKQTSAPTITPAPAPPVNSVQPSQVTQPTATNDAQSTALPPLAGDKIEKEWINKAKQIVNSTRTDPFKQKNEMSRVKAAYIEKRFNKKLKTDEVTA